MIHELGLLEWNTSHWTSVLEVMVDHALRERNQHIFFGGQNVKALSTGE